MTEPEVLVAVQDGVGTVTLNRPDKLNAYTPEMGDQLLAAFRALRDDAAVRVLVFTGAGRGFCAGVDLERLKAQQGGGDRLGREAFLTAFPLEVAACPKPTIAAVNGAAVGVGVTMILPMDVRIAAEKAKLGLTFAKLGILPGLGSTHLLAQLVGRAKARELVLGAGLIRAPEAAEIGLVNRVVAGETLRDDVRALALEMAECRPEVLAAAKRVLDFGASHGLEDALYHEQRASAELRRASRKG